MDGLVTLGMALCLLVSCNGSGGKDTPSSVRSTKSTDVVSSVDATPRDEAAPVDVTADLVEVSEQDAESLDAGQSGGTTDLGNDKDKPAESLSRPFDPIPVESAAPADLSTRGTSATPAVSADEEIVPVKEGVDPFSSLPGPKPADLPDSDPRTDQLRLAPKLPAEPGEVQVAFPPKEVVAPPAVPEVLPMAVVRHVPEGDVDLRAAVTASFNQPMVPLTSLAELERMEVPLTIDPLPKGRFIWLGTDTVAFEPEYRLPYGNRFTATVKAGVTSALGGVMAGPFQWTFETPRPRAEGVSPYPGAVEVVLDPEIQLTFNAAMDPADVLGHVKLVSNEGHEVPLALGKTFEAPPKTGNPITDAENELSAQRTVVLQLKEKLRPGTRYEIRIDDSLVSKEGPMPTGQSQLFQFSTYDPLVINRIFCGWEETLCYPGSPIYIEFNNTLKKKKKFEKLISVDPMPADFRVFVNGNTVTLTGAFKPSASYKVTAGKGFVDVHEQTNKEGKDRQVTYRAAYPMLSLVRTGLAVVENLHPATLLMTSLNITKVKVRIASIPESQFGAAFEASNHWYNEREDPLKGFKVVVDKELDLGEADNEIRRTDLDLSPALEDGKFGTVFLDVTTRVPTGFLRWETFRQMALVQSTNLAVTAGLSEESIAAMVTTLDGGKSVPGAEVRLVNGVGKVLDSGKTDRSGMVRLKSPFTAGSRDSSTYFLIAGHKKEKVFLLLNGYGNGDYLSSYQYYNWNKPGSVLMGEVFTDRSLYRPAEEINVSAILRKKDWGPDGDLGRLGKELKTCSYSVQDPRGGEVTKGDMTLTPFGTGSFTLTTEKNAPLGYYSIYLACGGESTYGTFQLQEYRTPEYKSTVQWMEDGSNLLVYRQLPAHIQGSYFFGAPMNGAQVSWTLRRTASSYTPPGNSGFSFTDVDPDELTTPWSRWDYRGSYDEVFNSGDGALDAQGGLDVNLTLDPGIMKRRPVSFTLEAEIFDKNRQSIAARSALIAHWAERYVGIRLDRTVVAEGETVEVSGVVTALNGSRHTGAQVDIELMEAVWESKEDVSPNGDVSYNYAYREVSSGKCSFTTGEQAATCRIKVPRPGTYLVRASTLDKAGRPATAAVWMYAYGEGARQWTSSSRNVVEMVLDKESYEAGETAQVLFQSPFIEGAGFVLLGREGISEVYPIQVKNGTAMVKIPLKELWLPSIHLRVVVVRGRTEKPGETLDDRGRPMVAYGEKSIAISKRTRTLQVDVAPSAPAVEPGGTLDITVTTRSPDGKPVSANVALMVVDEGVLSLIAYATPSPVDFFYPSRSSGTQITQLYDWIVPRAKPKLELSAGAEEDKAADAMPAPAPMMEQMASPMRASVRMKSMAEPEMAMAEESAGAGMMGGANGDDEVAAPSFSLREFFKSTAYFNGELQTNEQGTATVTVTMPANLTEFRVMAVAADNGVNFGADDTQVQTRRPLVIRPSLPRFLNLGDTFEASAVVNNETGKTTDVMVRLLADNAEVLDGVQTVRVPAGDSREVHFKARTVSPGPATFQFAALALTRLRQTDAAQIILPVLIPATAEAFATYGVVDKAVRQPLAPPANVLPGFGGLDVTLSSTALTGLQDAVKYLFDYPYECTEQICSRILPILALEYVIRDFGLGKASSPEEARKLVQEGIAKLWLNQRDDGGFGTWTSSKVSWLYISAYAVMTLEWARKRGFEVEEYRLQQAIAFLKNRLDHPHDWEETAYGAQTMAALVLTRLGQAPKKHLDRLYNLAVRKVDKSRGEWDQMELYTEAWLMEALFLAEKDSARVKELKRRLENAAVETASAIHFAETMRESMRLMMHSDERTDAIVLHALMVVSPKDSMIDKVVRGLVRSRAHGHWGSTQGNAYALLALSEYYRLYETETPDFKAGLWWGKTPLMGFQFKGRTMDLAKTRVPMADLLKGAAEDLILAKSGPGRLYYRLGLRYAPADLKLEAEDRGFLVERTYLKEGKDGELTRNEDGSWIARAGTYIRVKIRVVAPDRRYYVAVVDPLPAGLEAVNEAFVTSATSRLGQAESESWNTSPRWWWWYWNPWDFEERRDDRVQLFMDRMYGGVYEYTYTARATTIGEFVVPPTRAEEMYEPETFGRSASERMTVVAQ